jgi:hypothetical protein
MASTKKLTTKAAIEQVLTGQRKPMTVAQITEAALPLMNLKAATPKAGLLLRPVFGEQEDRRARHPRGLGPRRDLKGLWPRPTHRPR